MMLGEWSPGRHAATWVLAVLLLALGALAIAPSASAYTLKARKGSTGKVVLYQLQGSHYNSCWLPAMCWTPYITFNSPQVVRAPASRGAQEVVGQFDLYRLDGRRWLLSKSIRRRATIPRGSRQVVLTPAINFMPLRAQSDWGAFFTFTWYTAGGRWLGRKKMDMDQNGDYRCSTQFLCSVRGGHIWIN